MALFLLRHARTGMETQKYLLIREHNDLVRVLVATTDITIRDADISHEKKSLCCSSYI
jgi:hypothetical protein